jgi:hypothetical protein
MTSLTDDASNGCPPNERLPLGKGSLYFHARFSSRIRTYQSPEQNLVRRSRIALPPHGLRRAVS